MPKFDDNCELSLPEFYYYMVMSEKKVFKRRFAKNEKFDIMKIDTNLISYESPNFENTELNNESCDFSENFSEIVLCNTLPLSHNLNFYKLKTSPI